MRKLRELPTTADAEKWLTPYTFVVKGKVYIVDSNGQVTATKCTDCEGIK